MKKMSEQSNPGLLPSIPQPRVLWRSFSFWIWVVYALIIIKAIPHYFVQYWFNQSLGYQSIFWTNVRMQFFLFVIYSIAVAVAIYVPIRLHAVSRLLRKSAIHFSIWIGMFAGWLLAKYYLQFLLAFNGVPFGKMDPVFGKDIGFYVYTLPTLKISLAALEIMILLSAISFLIARWNELSSKGIMQKRQIRIGTKICHFLSPLYLRVFLYCFGAVVVSQTYLSRYSLLFRNNKDSGVRTGADYLDVTGIFSSLNRIYLTTIVAAGFILMAGIFLHRIKKHYGRITSHSDPEDLPLSGHTVRLLRVPLATGAGLLIFLICFSLCVIIRDSLFVKPNEPYIQLEYIKRHIDSTNKAYRLDNIEVYEWDLPDEPLPPETLLASKTLRNVPYLPTWTTYLEEPPDLHHYERIEVSDSTMVFGPMLQIYQQQQQLRPYYDFLSVDGVRYTVDGQKQMFVSSVRELPSLAFVGKQEWLKYWGSAALLLTHGMGLVMSPANQIDEMGSPEYVVKDVPPMAAHPAFDHEPRIYFGEGTKDDYVLTNIKYLKEFDYATAQNRQEFTFPDNLIDGLPVSSVFHRLIFALYSKDVTAFLFSRYIDHEKTRVHIRRTPITRVDSIAPFLFLDSNIYAFIADKKVLWMINGLTTSKQYPYSFREILGDKADERALEKFPERIINYAEDSVKVTIDAYSGEVHFYKIADDPIINTWAKIYEDLFEPISAMPKEVKAQLTYPLQWFHIQFDDIYKRYHQKHAIEFYNVEDLWDDADEVLGSIGRGLSGFGTEDQLTFSYEGYNILLDPADLPSGVEAGNPGELKYVMLMPFTPEGARNLRSLIIAFQDPDDYGRLISLRIPQGVFVPGPEQNDAYICNDRPVHQQVTMWIRHSSEVIRGGTYLLPIGGDLLYLETIWANSLQNELPQLKLFAVRYHDLITSGTSLKEAILNRNLVLGPTTGR
ncbi:MAG: UPF0182 family protein [Candidatus Aminicenantes bacterium]|nr:MAG: UPF0182 family protein [Candidatus Aminicenantes bacterium]